MPTKFARQLATAQRQIKAKGQLVLYTQALDAFVPNNSDVPYLIGPPLAPVAAQLNNVVNVNYPQALTGHSNTSLLQTGVDPNTPNDPISLYCVFLDAKARGSTTQGMSAEYLQRIDVVGGNKLGLIAGGQIVCKLGDLIDRNTEGRSGYPIARVSKIKALEPDGFPLLYTLELEL